ncbi:MAG: DNA primase [Clostridiales bacterium]|nr:DNA primase [Clostridiales bacterium]
MAIPQSFVEQLKSRIEIEELIGAYVRLRRQGRSLVGLCPFHSEKTPSFNVFADTQSYYCFGCGAGGDAISFVRAIEHLDYVEAIRLLAERAGLAVPEEQVDPRAARQRADVLELNRQAARFFHEQLRGSREAVRYLSGRGLSQKTILHFGLGYAPDSWDALLSHLKAQGHTEPDIRRAGLCAVGAKGGAYDYFRKRIIFPIIDVRGKVVGFGGRVLDDSKPKYLNSSDTPVFKKSHGLFSLNNAKAAGGRRLILAEGYLDVMALWQAGFTESVATLGTALSSDQARLMARYADEVVIAYDSDEAGRKATDRAIRILGEAGLKTRVLTLEQAKDPDEYLRRFGADKLSAQLARSESSTQYRLQQAARPFDLNEPEGKVGYFREAALLLAELGSPVELDIYAGQLAERLGVDRDSVLTEVARIRRDSGKKQRRRAQDEEQRRLAQGNPRVNPERAQHLRASRIEEEILCLLFAHPDFYEALRRRISADDFVTAFNRRVFEALAAAIEAGDQPDLSCLQQDFSIEEIGAAAGMLARRRGMPGSQAELMELAEGLVEAAAGLRRAAAGVDEQSLQQRLRELGQKK